MYLVVHSSILCTRYFAKGCSDEWGKINERCLAIHVPRTVAVPPLFGPAMTDPSCKVGGLLFGLLASFTWMNECIYNMIVYLAMLSGTLCGSTSLIRHGVQSYSWALFQLRQGQLAYTRDLCTKHVISAVDNLLPRLICCIVWKVFFSALKNRSVKV